MFNLKYSVIFARSEFMAALFTCDMKVTQSLNCKIVDASKVFPMEHRIHCESLQVDCGLKIWSYQYLLCELFPDMVGECKLT